MKISPRRLRLLVPLCVVALAGLVVGVGALVWARRPGQTVPAPAPLHAVAAVSRVAPAPLLLVPIIDVSGSMAKSDPRGLRYWASNAMLSSVAGARPAPARTYVSALYFGTGVRAGRTSLLGRVATKLGFPGYLGFTDFAKALRAALPAVEAFRLSDSGASGRAICVIVTDGAPDVPGARSARAVWAGIDRAVSAVGSAGAEVYLLGVSDDSRAWKSAAARWRALLGSSHVLLARSAGGLGELYVAFAATALDLGVEAGSPLGPHQTAALTAGRYAESFLAMATATKAGSSFTIKADAEASATPVRLAEIGEQVTMRLPATAHERVVVENTTDATIVVSLTDRVAVLRPVRASAPSAGAPLRGLLLELRDGDGTAIVSDPSDPLAVKADLSWSETTGVVRSVHLSIRSLGEGFYEARAAGGSLRWPARPCRLTVLTRSVEGETGREDYALEPTTTAWASLTEPVDPDTLADASSVPVRVALHSALASTLGVESTAAAGAMSVSAELRTLGGRVVASSWLRAGAAGSYTGTLSAKVADGVLRLTVVGPDGAAVSSREIPWRMRPTRLQRVIGGVARTAGVVAAVLAALVAFAGVWLLLKPPLAGSVIVRGGGPRPQRFGVFGQRIAVVDVDDSVGSERWLVLPCSRDAVRVLELGPLPRQALLRRGKDVPFQGRVARLV